MGPIYEREETRGDDLTLTLTNSNGEVVGNVTDALWEATVRRRQSGALGNAKKWAVVGEQNLIVGFVTDQVAASLQTFSILSYTVEFECEGRSYEDKMVLSDLKQEEGEWLAILTKVNRISVKG